MRSELASGFSLVQVPNRPQDPDVRFFAWMAAAAETRPAPGVACPNRKVRRRGTWTESLRRARRSGKSFALAAGCAGLAASGVCDRSRRAPILHALHPSTER